MGRPPTRLAWRLNAWLSGLLLISIVVAGNRLAREHLAWRVDLSEDQLYAPSPVGRRMLGELDDVLAVKAYFTGKVKLGPVQIAKRRLIDQLEEIADAAGGKVELTFVDPNASTEARAEAHGLGIEPAPLSAVQGTSEVTQEVYLGLVLRYRGAEAVLPFVLPQTFEYAFLSTLRRLAREEEVAIGFLTRGGDSAADDGFADARELLRARYRVTEVLDLSDGEAVSEEVAVLIVAAPQYLHPRVVFAIDQFVQRGGRVLFLVDHALIDLRTGTLAQVETGLDELFARWGVPVDRQLVWDQDRSNTINTFETVDIGGEQRRVGEATVRYPFWPRITPEGLDKTSPVTARLNGADLFWVHPIRPSERVPRHVERRTLAESSPASWRVAAEDAMILDPAELDAKAVELVTGGLGGAQQIIVSLAGRFPSPFVDGAPAPLDALREAEWRDACIAAVEAGVPIPPREVPTTEEKVASEATAGQVVVVGDADWARDGDFFTARNRLLLENLVDWLALEDELLTLRSRTPPERRIDDFVEEERRALGLVLPSHQEVDVHDEGLFALEEQAQRHAARRRGMYMAGAVLGSFLLAIVAGLVGLLFTRAGSTVPRDSETGGTR